MSDTWISLGDATANVINSIAEKHMPRTNSDLKTRALRIVELEEIAKDAADDVKAAYDAAASVGFTRSALKRAVKIHRMDPDKRAKFDAAQMDLELYLAEIEGRKVQEAAA